MIEKARLEDDTKAIEEQVCQELLKDFQEAKKKSKAKVVSAIEVDDEDHED